MTIPSISPRILFRLFGFIMVALMTPPVCVADIIVLSVDESISTYGVARVDEAYWPPPPSTDPPTTFYEENSFDESGETGTVSGSATAGPSPLTGRTSFTSGSAMLNWFMLDETLSAETFSLFDGSGSRGGSSGWIHELYLANGRSDAAFTITFELTEAYWADVTGMLAAAPGTSSPSGAGTAFDLSGGSYEGYHHVVSSNSIPSELEADLDVSALLYPGIYTLSLTSIAIANGGMGGATGGNFMLNLTVIPEPCTLLLLGLGLGGLALHVRRRKS